MVGAQLLENDQDCGALAVEVKLTGRTDYIISAMDQKERQFGPVTVAGQFGFVSVDDQGKAVAGLSAERYGVAVWRFADFTGGGEYQVEGAVGGGQDVSSCRAVAGSAGSRRVLFAGRRGAPDGF